MKKALRRLSWRILSVPIFPKTLGIGAVVALVFGSATLLETRKGLSQNLYKMLRNHTIAEARALAVYVERPLTTGDRVAVVEQLRRATSIHPDVRYVIVRDPGGGIFAHSFEGSLPTDLVTSPQASSLGGDGLRIIQSVGEGLIFEATAPVLEGRAGAVQIGFSDDLVTRELGALTRSVILGLGISVEFGIGLAIVLSYILTRPILDLKRVAGRIKEGDFAARAGVYSADEIGDLAVAFNDMAESLLRYRREVEQKEKVRLALIDRIVGSQEVERKLISRELHDEFGQSLLAILMEVQSSPKYACLPDSVRRGLESEVSDAIDALRRIIKGMRPTVLDDYGLDSALQSYVQEVGARTDLKVTYKYRSSDPAPRLEGSIEVTLYRVAQEAITNVIRHAGAAHLSVVVLQAPDAVRLLVEDDGRGFDPGAVRTDRSLGLVGMRERLALLGGSLDIESIPAEGTTLRAQVPLSAKPS